MNCKIGVISCKGNNRKLLDKVFELKSIKRGGKIPFQQFKEKIHLNFKQMSSQITNNNYATAPTSPNLYITRKLNNMNKVKAFKEKQDDWTRLYYKMLKEIEAMINIQKQVQDMMKIAEETNTTITEMEQIILQANINN